MTWISSYLTFLEQNNELRDGQISTYSMVRLANVHIFYMFINNMRQNDLSMDLRLIRNTLHIFLWLHVNIKVSVAQQKNKIINNLTNYYVSWKYCSHLLLLVVQSVKQLCGVTAQIYD